MAVVGDRFGWCPGMLVAHFGSDEKALRDARAHFV